MCVTPALSLLGDRRLLHLVLALTTLGLRLEANRFGRLKAACLAASGSSPIS
jgi:hypothetical protein